MDDIDDLVNDESDHGSQGRRAREFEDDEPATPSASSRRRLVGTVDRFFDKINVAAVNVVGRIRIGDRIEIECGSGALRTVISEMQIDRKDVEEANEGDDVGIKLPMRVPVGSSVYAMEG